MFCINECKERVFKVLLFSISMRKILTPGEKEKKDTRNKVIIGLILVGIMVLSTVGYSFFSGSEEKVKKINYNDIDFVLNENGLWQFKIQNFEFLTQNNPKDTENISVLVFKTANDFYGKPLFFLGEGVAKQEIAQNLRNFALRMQDACIKNYEDMCEKDAPIKNCSQDNLIIIKETNYTEISYEDNCIFILSPYEEQVRVADAFIFKILGVRNL